MLHAFPDLADQSVWLVVPLVAGLIALRYVVLAGGALALITTFGRRLRHRRIQPIPFARRQLWREFGYSMLTALIFTLVGLFTVTVGREWGLSKVYLDPDQHGLVWLLLSVPVVVLIHDTYFYWTHRFMHLPSVYERVHKVHHLSTNPSPLAAMAFHPLEAVIEAGVIVFLTMLVPIHIGVLAVWALYMFATNVMGHLGYELLPRGLATHPLFGWLNTATGHNQHHRTFRSNYGLYTTIWDRLMGTLHPRYAELYDRTTGSRPTPDAAERPVNTGAPS
ncbi:sterol desaturase family protein [Brevundimonas aurifodinae]|uniref:Sterol desaturase family protein n=1 Tax=Brevundimonas aurifodinae TaxID=1508312 RepID=A0ABV1NL13_9CAUL